MKSARIKLHLNVFKAFNTPQELSMCARVVRNLSGSEENFRTPNALGEPKFANAIQELDDKFEHGIIRRDQIIYSVRQIVFISQISLFAYYVLICNASVTMLGMTMQSRDFYFTHKRRYSREIVPLRFAKERKIYFTTCHSERKIHSQVQMSRISIYAYLHTGVFANVRGMEEAVIRKLIPP